MLDWIKNLQWKVSFIEPGNTFTEILIDFYNLICVYLIFIIFLIGYWMFFILKNHTFKKNFLLNYFNWDFILREKNNIKYFFNTKLSDRSFPYIAIYDIKDYPLLEGTWCIVPLTFISVAAYPSISLEYGISPDITPLVTVKVLANQWYWIFDIEAKVSPSLCEIDEIGYFFKSDLYNLYKENSNDVEAFYHGMDNLDYQLLKKVVEVNLNKEDPGFFRLLAIDNKIILPINTPIKFVITSIDILHSFALPAFSVKIDAIPGRLSEQIILIERPGLFWGQCSELCGPYHGFMPVLIEGTSFPLFVKSFF